MSKNISAWTAVVYSGPYPPYISINENELGQVFITVRQPDGGNDTITATIEIPKADLKTLFENGLSKLNEG